MSLRLVPAFVAAFAFTAGAAAALPSPVPDDLAGVGGLSQPMLVTAVTDAGPLATTTCSPPLLAALSIPADEKTPRAPAMSGGFSVVCIGE